MENDFFSSDLKIFISRKILLSSLITVFLLALFQTSTFAQQKIIHPRLLIGERDSITGLAALKARYAAGMRPSDDIAGWALSYLLTNDETFARRAVEEMRRTHPPEKVGSRTYMDYVRWSLAFDWLYNYKGFDAALKDRIAGELLSGAQKMLSDELMKNPNTVMYHNYTMRYLTLASFALAAIEDYPAV